MRDPRRLSEHEALPYRVESRPPPQVSGEWDLRVARFPLSKAIPHWGRGSRRQHTHKPSIPVATSKGWCVKVPMRHHSCDIIRLVQQATKRRRKPLETGRASFAVENQPAQTQLQASSL